MLCANENSSGPPVRAASRGKERSMAKESSFDIVSTVDMQEIDNAFQQAKNCLLYTSDAADEL